MRKQLAALSAIALLVVALPVGGAAADTPLDVVVTRAPVTPDGTTAGAITDFVLTFRDPDPTVDGIGLLDGATVEVTLPDDFVNTGAGAPNLGILLQGWPQSPPGGPPTFSTTTVSGNTVTVELTKDYLVGDAGPGPKQVHLLLNAFRNPGVGRYAIDLSIHPDPGSDTVYHGTGIVHIIPKARPSVNVVSVFSGAPAAPPPFNNPLYQTVDAGDDANNVGLYLWDGGSSVADGVLTPFVGVDVEMTNRKHGRLTHDGRTVGHVWIDAPRGATDYGISTAGPSELAKSFATMLDVGVLVTTFGTDAAVAGDYTVTFRINNGNTQQLHITAE